MSDIDKEFMDAIINSTLPADVAAQREKLTTTEYPDKSGKAECRHEKLRLALQRSGLGVPHDYPRIEIDRGVVVTPALIMRLLAVVEEVEGALDPDLYPEAPIPVPINVVDAVEKVYEELER